MKLNYSYKNEEDNVPEIDVNSMIMTLDDE